MRESEVNLKSLWACYEMCIFQKKGVSERITKNNSHISHDLIKRHIRLGALQSSKRKPHNSVQQIANSRSHDINDKESSAMLPRQSIGKVSGRIVTVDGEALYLQL